MHELSVAQSVVDAVLEQTGDQTVTVVRIRVGRLSGVVPDALMFCYELVTADTTLAGSRLSIEEPPGRMHCRRCGQDADRDDLILLCPCGSADVEVISGRELQLASVDVR